MTPGRSGALLARSLPSDGRMISYPGNIVNHKTVGQVDRSSGMSSFGGFSCKTKLTTSNTKNLFMSFVIYSLIIFSIYCISPSSKAGDVTRYGIEIYDVYDAKVISTFVCEDNKQFCRVAVPIKARGAHHSLNVAAFFEPGNAYFSFSIEGNFLRVGSDSFYQMSIDSSGPQESKVPLYEPLPAESNEDNQALAKTPVPRYSTTIFNILQITVRSLRRYYYNIPDMAH
jgi:hypothetical protein